MGEWYAHSHERLPAEQWHLLCDHLGAVGEQAGIWAKQFGAESMGRAAGLLHDVGKYSSPFQARLKGAPRRVDHSTAGAIIAENRYRTGRHPIGRLIAAAIAGHHAGLADGRGFGERTSLDERLKQTLGSDLPALESAWQSEITLPQRLDSLPIKKYSNPAIANQRCGFQLAFLVRMLFSCLVDADYLDTEAWFAAIDSGPPPRGGWPSLAQLKAALDGHLAGFAGRTSEVDTARADVLEACRAAAALAPGLFSLTVPTGGGKTLSGLAFALDHAVRWQLDRVIYVAPFTSVIEQNAGAFRRALAPYGGAVLEHHSAFTDDAISKERKREGGEGGPEAAGKLKLAMENWDAPVVATTAVQFFESLFAAAPSRCRKLHNIARSVVILDEAQTLPLPLLRPCIAAIDELARNYGTTLVLCTATQPAIEDHPERPPDASFKGGLRDVRAIVPKTQRDALFRRLSRVRFERLGELGDDVLASMLRDREQVLCIVNTRGHARALFEALRGEPGAGHLSTWMFAAHRTRVLAGIRDDLTNGRPCRVVSTSLVEAGVDVDFPCVFRAEAGLDSIAQAAGRCNREGRRPMEESVVAIFRAAGAKAPLEIRQRSPPSARSRG
ncbi:MAG: CRISPR-associated endonuclease Cas3'' [Rhodospirillales bacterium]|nr:CRISPR-associated endonuclease Cas3'' [Rhodospirillales bacterium]